MFKAWKQKLVDCLSYGAKTPAHGVYLANIRLKKITINISQWLLLICIIIIWEWAARYGAIDSFITSQPSKIGVTTYKMFWDGSLISHTLVTVYETVLGFLLGTGIGIAAAIVLWWSDFISKVTEPYIVVLNSMPKIALGPIFIVWLGNGKAAIIVMALFISVITAILVVYSGFREVDQNKIKLIQTFGANKLQILQKVILPASVPTIFAAVKVSVGLSLVGVIVGEFLVSKAGLGYLIIYGGQVFNMTLVMTSVIILSIVAYVMYALVVCLENHFLKWRQ